MAAKYKQRLAQVNADWDSLLRVELGPVVVRSADDVVKLHGLRGFDAIHLASAIWLKDRSGTEVCFAVFGQRLRPGAAQAGLAV